MPYTYKTHYKARKQVSIVKHLPHWWMTCTKDSGNLHLVTDLNSNGLFCDCGGYGNARNNICSHVLAVMRDRADKDPNVAPQHRALLFGKLPPGKRKRRKKHPSTRG